MKIAYEKPCCIDLILKGGESQAVCLSGSTANTPDVNKTCMNGNVAGGAGCSFGYQPNDVACNSGTIAKYFGCLDGLQATDSCSNGNSATKSCLSGSGIS